MDFLNRYFIYPFLSDSGYNFVNTFVYSLIALAALYLIFKILYKRIKFDKQFLITLIPFILTGSLIRALVDHHYIKYTPFTVSPGIYIVIGLTYLFILLATIWASKSMKKPYWKICFLVGMIFLTAVIVLTRPNIKLHWLPFVTLVLSIVCCLPFLVAQKLIKKSFFDFMALSALFGQFLDGFTTTLLVDFFGFIEKHPLPRLMAQYFGSASTILFLKASIVLLLIFFCTKYLKKQERNFILTLPFVLGLAQASRNLLTFLLL